MKKRYASHILIINNEFHKNHIVELINHLYSSHYPLTEEQAMTEWIGGTIIIQGDQAYHTPHVLTPTEFSTDYCSRNSHIKRL